MQLQAHILILLCFVSTLIVLHVGATDCDVSSSCIARCEGKSFNLKRILGSKTKNIQDTDESNGVYYFLVDLCKGVSCSDVPKAAICQKKQNGTSAFSLGPLSSGLVTLSNTSDFTVTYNGYTEGDGNLRVAIIKFMHGKKSDFKYEREESGGVSTINYYFSVGYTDESAPIGYVGWGIIAFALIAFAIYFVVGIIYMYFAKGARGIEVIPHLNYWKSLPSLIIEGCLFVISPCRRKLKGGGEYEKI